MSSTVRLNRREVEFLFSNMKKRRGKWKGITKAQRAFKEEFGKSISRPTIYKIIELYPEGTVKKAKKIEPRYVTEFTNTEAWKRLKDHKYATEIKFSLLTAWRLLGKKEPVDWTIEDVQELRKPMVGGKDNILYLNVTKDISPKAATSLRRAFRGLSLYDLVKPLEHVPKRPLGTRKQWYLENSEIIKLFEGIEKVDTLLFVVLDLQCGARPNSMVRIKVSDINFGKNYIYYYESKTKEHIPRFFIPETMSLLRRYISDMRLKLTDRLLKRSLRNYTEELKAIGKKQGIEKLIVKGAGAYVLRHTFATQASEHDVSLEVVMKQGNWKDAKTLMDHYMFIKTSKMMRELLGVEVEKPKNFGEWVKQFVPYWEKKYLEIRPVI